VIEARRQSHMQIVSRTDCGDQPRREGIFLREPVAKACVRGCCDAVLFESDRALNSNIARAAVVVSTRQRRRRIVRSAMALPEYWRARHGELGSST
jgi:hypothetical protein